MEKHFKLFGCNVMIVFNTMFAKRDKTNQYAEWKYNQKWPPKWWDLGISFTIHQCVAKKEFNAPKKWHENLLNSYRIDVKLIAVKFAIEWDFGVMHFFIKELFI